MSRQGSHNFTKEEDEYISQYIRTHVPKNSRTIPRTIWKQIKDSLLPNRTEISIKNRFYRFINQNIHWIPTAKKYNNSTSDFTENNESSQTSSSSSQSSIDFNTQIPSMSFEEHNQNNSVMHGLELSVHYFQTGADENESKIINGDSDDDDMSYADVWSEIEADSDDEGDDEANQQEPEPGPEQQDNNQEEDEDWTGMKFRFDIVDDDQFFILEQKLHWLSYLCDAPLNSLRHLTHMFGGNLLCVYKYASHEYSYETMIPWSVKEDQIILTGRGNDLRSTRTEEEITHRSVWLRSDLCMKLLATINTNKV